MDTIIRYKAFSLASRSCSFEWRIDWRILAVASLHKDWSKWVKRPIWVASFYLPEDQPDYPCWLTLSFANLKRVEAAILKLYPDYEIGHAR